MRQMPEMRELCELQNHANLLVKGGEIIHRNFIVLALDRVPIKDYIVSMKQGNWRNWDETKCSHCAVPMYIKYANKLQGKYYCPTCYKKLNHPLGVMTMRFKGQDMTEIKGDSVLKLVEV